MGYRQAAEALQWLAYMGRTRNIIQAGKGREVNLVGVPNLKLMCIAKRQMKSEYLGRFGMGVFACPIDTSPLVTPTRHCITGMSKQWRGCRKSKTEVIKWF
jgi:predicted Fe-S protein YdhL (DUF1289 family)